MSALHVLTPRLAFAADNTDTADASALLAAKASGGSSSGHGAAKITGAAALAAKLAAPAAFALPETISPSATGAAAPGSLNPEEAQRLRESLAADLKLLQDEFERFQRQQPQRADAQVRARMRPRPIDR